MSKKILATLIILTILATTAMLNYQIQRLEKPRTLGEIIPAASASPAIEKSMGDWVYYKCKIKNTGGATTKFLVFVEFRKHGTTTWHGFGDNTVENINLSPGQESGIISIPMQLIEGRVEEGKYYDAKWFLCEQSSGDLLDSKVLENAWYVKYSTSGTITSYWVE